MSTEKWNELKDKQKKAWENFMKVATIEEKKLDTEKAKLLEPYGGKKYDAPQHIQQIIENNEAKFLADFKIGGKLAKELEKEHAKQEAKFIKMQGIIADKDRDPSREH